VRPKILSPAAIDVLTAMDVAGREARITSGRLDRALYLEVNAALEAIGGKWNRKAKAHLFDGDPADAIDQVAVDGAFTDKRRDLNQFMTPPELAVRVVSGALVRGASVLEPSAGEGALACEALRQGAVAVVCLELDMKRVVALQANLAATQPAGATTKTIDVWAGCDFTRDPGDFGTFQRVVMNPPFARQQDIAHVTRAFRYLKPGGLLVAIMSAGVKFRGDKKTVAFRALVDQTSGTIEDLPEQSFRASGADVRTVLVTIEKAKR
jgi:predicted RNA methylase